LRDVVDEVAPQGVVKKISVVAEVERAVDDNKNRCINLSTNWKDVLL